MHPESLDHNAYMVLIQHNNDDHIRSSYNITGENPGICIREEGK